MPSELVNHEGHEGARRKAIQRAHPSWYFVSFVVLLSCLSLKTLRGYGNESRQPLAALAASPRASL